MGQELLKHDNGTRRTVGQTGLTSHATPTSRKCSRGAIVNEVKALGFSGDLARQFFLHWAFVHELLRTGDRFHRQERCPDLWRNH
jgi:hypothetical protein